MKNLFKKLENLFTASAFAEAGEHETARKIMSERKPVEQRIRRAGKEPRPRLNAN